MSSHFLTMPFSIGYEICSMVRAAEASSPHMMSLICKPSMLSPFSSVRRIGRPTMEGNWCSGKFCAA